jgi:hypothetical protein
LWCATGLASATHHPMPAKKPSHTDLLPRAPDNFTLEMGIRMWIDVMNASE